MLELKEIGISQFRLRTILPEIFTGYRRYPRHRLHPARNSRLHVQRGRAGQIRILWTSPIYLRNCPRIDDRRADSFEILCIARNDRQTVRERGGGNQ